MSGNGGASDLIFSACFSLLFVVCLINNSIIITLTWRKKVFKDTYQARLFIMHTAIVDAFAALDCLASAIGYYDRGFMERSTYFCEFEAFREGIAKSQAHNSLLLLAINRCYMVVKPAGIDGNDAFSRHMSVVYIICSWAYSIWVSAVLKLSYHHAKFDLKFGSCFLVLNNVSFLPLLFLRLVTVCAILFCYLRALVAYKRVNTTLQEKAKVAPDSARKDAQSDSLGNGIKPKLEDISPQRVSKRDEGEGHTPNKTETPQAVIASTAFATQRISVIGISIKSQLPKRTVSAADVASKVEQCSSKSLNCSILLGTVRSAKDEGRDETANLSKAGEMDMMSATKESCTGRNEEVDGLEIKVLSPKPKRDCNNRNNALVKTNAKERDNPRQKKKAARGKRFDKITKTFILITLYYFLSSAPSMIPLDYFHLPFSPETLLIISRSTLFLYYTNYCTSALIFAIVKKEFRTETKKLFGLG